MFKLDRRQALGLIGATTLAAPAAAQTAAPGAFAHGVASGDPLADRVILWTRVAPTEGQRTRVTWELSENPAFHKGLRKGVAWTDAAHDGTVKVDVAGLKPGRDYYYRFSAGGVQSPTGRTRTLPKGPTQEVVLAVASCALWPGGFFNAYEAIAAQPRVDAVVHLGDYIYEYGPEGYGGDIGAKLGRIPEPPHEILTLADYRARHAQAKSDPKLQAAHAKAPWIVVWDDHEVANDSWMGGAENHQPATEGAFDARKANALRAWYEWMPIRDPRPGAAFEAINRSFHFGDLASLIMVETRLAARSHQLTYEADLLVDGKPNPDGFKAKYLDPSRTMMGEKQEAWLAGELASSVAAGRPWQVLGNQVVLARVLMPDVRSQMSDEAFNTMLAGLPEEYKAPVLQAQAIAHANLPYDLDAWDGYPVARERLYGVVKQTGAHAVVLSGDSHAFWANELHDMTGARVGAEFGTTGITSPGFNDVLVGAPVNEAFVARNPEVKYTDHGAKGFILLTLTPQSATADYLAVSTIYAPQYETRLAKRFRVDAAQTGVGAMTELS